MTWREHLIQERDNYAQALANQTIYPGMNWPQSQQHYLDRIEQINRILATDGGHDLADVLPTGRITRAVV
jgi:hypothetical protein